MIGGVSVSLATYQLGKLVVFSRGSYGTLAFYQRGGALPGLPDPFIGKEAVLTINGTVRFKGDVVAAHPEFNQLGWTVAYQCLSLRHRGDRFPHVDAATGSQVSRFNLQPEDPLYDATRAGRSVGQVLTTVMTSTVNGAALTAHGLGNLTFGGGLYSLPTATTTDLAALSVIPPTSISFGGERFLTAVESFLSQWAPNHMLWVDPTTGAIRFLDTRTFTPATLTLGTDPIDPTPLSRDIGSCFQRVVVQGRPIAVMALLKYSNGTLLEDFGHDGLSNADAKAAWTANDWKLPGTAIDTGTVTCSSTTSIQYTSTNTARTYGSGDLDWSHRQALIQLSSTIISDYTQFWSAKVANNTALVANGTMTITPDHALPHTSFDHATLTMQAQSASVVWTRYKIANTNLWPRVTNQSTYPAPLVNSAGGVSYVSSPMGLVLRSDGVTAPAPFTYNAATGQLRFLAPTFITGNSTAPTDVWAILPVWTQPLQAVSPADVGGLPQYTGTSNTVDGLTDTLYVEVDAWRDPAQGTQMLAFAADLLDSVKDAVVEGSVTYHGLYSTALAPGTAISVAGADYTTGWETAALAVVEVTVDWPIAGPTQHVTTLRCSQRKAHLSSAAFLSPDRAFIPIGAAEPLYGGLEFGGVLMPGFLSGIPNAADIRLSDFTTTVAPFDIGIARTQEEQRRRQEEDYRRRNGGEM